MAKHEFEGTDRRPLAARGHEQVAGLSQQRNPLVFPVGHVEQLGEDTT